MHILLQVIYEDYIYFVSHEIRLVVRPSQDFMVHVTDWLNVSIAHMSCMFHHLLLILYQSTDGQLVVWVGGLDSRDLLLLYLFRE